MFGSLSRRERRLVVSGGVLLGVAVVCLRIAPAWWRWTEASREGATAAVTELERARATVNTLSTTRDSLAARNARYLALAPAILSGRTPGAVGAALASAVSGAAAGAGLEVGSMSIRPDTGGTALFAQPSVRGDARGDVAGLTRFLVTLERGPMIFVVRQLTVSQPEPGAAADRPESLRVEFVVEALALEHDAVEARHVNERGRDRGGRAERGRAP
jgi:hypothetical protein